MTRPKSVSTKLASAAYRDRARALAYAAGMWSLVFAGVSFYWAVGGRLGLETLGPGLAALANDPFFVAVGLWGAGVAKLGGTLLALGLATHRPRRWLPALAAVAMGGGSLVTLYGLASLAQHGAMARGLIATPEALGPIAAWWHIVLWDPWWALGGVLFAAAGHAARRSNPRNQ